MNIDSAGSSCSKLESIIRVRRTDLDVSTVWTVEKFQQKLSAMRQLYEKAETSAADDADDASKEQDVLLDPDDAWMTDSPSSSESSRIFSPHV